MIYFSDFGTGGGGGGILAERWRILISATQGGGWPTLRDIELRDTPGSADQATGGTASALHGNGIAGNAFDDDTAVLSVWQGQFWSSPTWIEYNRSGSPYHVGEVRLRIADAVGDGPSAFTIQYHDGSGWVDYWSESGVSWSSNYEAKVFTKP